MTRVHVSTATLIGAAFAAVVGLGACGGGGHPTTAPPTSGSATSVTTAAPPTTHHAAVTTIPTLPPKTTAPPTTQVPPAPSTSASPPTAAPPTTALATSAGPPACKTGQLTATLTNGQGAAGTFYYELMFHNTGSTACTLYGYPGVSYVMGSQGIQVGDPADRNPTISGQSNAGVVTLAAGGTAHAVLAQVDVGNYPPATCQPVGTLGLRVYPPDQTAALFVPQTGTGCQATGVHQLGIGFIVP